jgi:hypothetical protein
VAKALLHSAPWLIIKVKTCSAITRYMVSGSKFLKRDQRRSGGTWRQVRWSGSSAGGQDADFHHQRAGHQPEI